MESLLFSKYALSFFLLGEVDLLSAEPPLDPGVFEGVSGGVVGRGIGGKSASASFFTGSFLVAEWSLEAFEELEAFFTALFSFSSNLIFEFDSFDFCGACALFAEFVLVSTRQKWSLYA